MKPGDTVQLKSGGPWMTINKITSDGNYALCDWFEKTNNKKGSFPLTSLRLVEIEDGGISTREMPFDID